jgi:hypothetical protein
MVQTRSDKHKNQMSFARLMRLGQVAHAQGDSKQAHDYWQQAAIHEPDNEQVWTALMWVLETDEDRKVCLKNILTISPNNLQAQEMLDELIGDTQADERVEPDIEPNAEPPPFPITRLVLRLIQSLVMGVLIALVLVLTSFVQLPF